MLCGVKCRHTCYLNCCHRAQALKARGDASSGDLHLLLFKSSWTELRHLQRLTNDDKHFVQNICSSLTVLSNMHFCFFFHQKCSLQNMEMIPNNNIYWPDFGLVQKWTKVLWQKLSDYSLMQYSRRSFIPRSQPSGRPWHHVLSHGPQYSWLVHQWLPGAADLNISLNTILDLRNELSLDPMSG